MTLIEQYLTVLYWKYIDVDRYLLYLYYLDIGCEMKYAIEKVEES